MASIGATILLFWLALKFLKYGITSAVSALTLSMLLISCFWSVFFDDLFGKIKNETVQIANTNIRVEEVKGEIDSLYPNRQYPFKPVYKIHISSMKGKEICEINWNNGEGLF